MKTKLLLSLLLSFVFYLLSSQVPQGFNYQAVARIANGDPIANTLLPVRVTIQSDSLGGTTYWIEEHSLVTTNNFGMFTLILGKGVRQSGSTVLTFNDIDWKISPKFIKTEINSGGWKYMGSSRLLAVPYSIVAGELGGAVKKLEVVGEDVQSEDALFEVKRKDGETMFAVYNQGVRVYMPLDTLSKARKGGFAIGGFSKSKGTTTIQDYFAVSPDSIRMYVDNNPGLKGSKGGFAVGGFSKVKGPVVPFLDLTPNNYFIGHESGLSTTTGLYNTFFGYQAGKANMDGNYNIIIGYKAGYNTRGPSGAVGGSEGSYNCYIGYNAGYSNVYGAHNTALGYGAGFNNTTDKNTFLGSLAGYSNSTGYSNTFIGTETGHLNTTGSFNVFLGRSAGNNVITGTWNTLIGAGAGANIEGGNKNIVIGSSAMGENFFAGSGSGSSNIVIGNQAGYSLADGSFNVFIGDQAGFGETGSNLLVIENGATGTPLVYGNFSTDLFRVNGKIEYMTIGTVSDARLKENISELTNVTEKLKMIRGVYYDWNSSGNSGLLLPDGRQIGVIAQEIEKVYPELVTVSDKGYKMVDYSKLTPVLIEAIKEQQKQIEGQQQQIESAKQENLNLKSELQLLKDRMEKIETIMAGTGTR